GRGAGPAPPPPGCGPAARDVLHRHGLLVIGQQAGRGPARPAQGHGAPPPPYPIAVIVSCATSARIFPFDRSTSSSSLARNGPVTPARRAGPAGTARPRSRSATYRATV